APSCSADRRTQLLPRTFFHHCAADNVLLPSQGRKCGLTIRSSRCRFAARLNSGVRLLGEKMGTLRIFVLASLLLATSAVSARDPAILFDTSSGQSLPVALVGVEEAFTDALDNCTQHITNVTVDEIAYDGASESIAGFRVDPD